MVEHQQGLLHTMYTDQTNAFRALLPSVTSPSTPSTTGPNGSGPSSRSTSPINGASISQKRHKGSRRQKGESEQDIKDREEEEAFMAEAYRIVSGSFWYALYRL